MPLLAAEGAIVACDKGSLLSPLGVIAVNPQVRATTKLAADIRDCKPNLNVRPFGMCSSMGNPAVQAATEAAEGVLTPAPCAPNIISAWSPGGTIVTIRKVPALYVGCSVSCTFGGSIEIKSAVQTIVKAGDLLAGKYRVERILGAGAMGMVLAATRIALDRCWWPRTRPGPRCWRRRRRRGEAAGDRRVRYQRSPERQPPAEGSTSDDEEAGETRRGKPPLAACSWSISSA